MHPTWNGGQCTKNQDNLQDLMFMQDTSKFNWLPGTKRTLDNASRKIVSRIKDGLAQEQLGTV